MIIDLCTLGGGGYLQQFVRNRPYSGLLERRAWLLQRGVLDRLSTVYPATVRLNVLFVQQSDRQHEVSVELGNGDPYPMLGQRICLMGHHRGADGESYVEAASNPGVHSCCKEGTRANPNLCDASHVVFDAESVGRCF